MEKIIQKAYILLLSHFISRKFMGNQQKAEEKERQQNVPKISSDKPKRTKQIRVTDETYSALMELGKMGDDFEDVISRLLKEHRDRRHG